jgi:hypothetical protein
LQSGKPTALITAGLATGIDPLPTFVMEIVFAKTRLNAFRLSPLLVDLGG